MTQREDLEDDGSDLSGTWFACLCFATIAVGGLLWAAAGILRLFQ